MIAKAVANATTAAFITMVGSEFVQKYLGEGPRMVRDVFRLGNKTIFRWLFNKLGLVISFIFVSTREFPCHCIH